MMNCPGCHMLIVDEGAYCGHCGEQLPSRPTRQMAQTRAFHEAQRNEHLKAPLPRPRGAMGDVQVQPAPLQSAANLPFPLRESARTPFPIANNPTPVPAISTSIRNPIPPRGRQTGSGTGWNIVFLGIILTLLLVGVLAGALTLLQHKHLPGRYSENSLSDKVQGSVTFSDGQEEPGRPNTTGKLSVRVSGLSALPDDGSNYAAWIVNEETEHIAPLGLLEQSGSTFKLDFQSDKGSVLALGNKLEITRENAKTSLPTGNVLLSARLPIMASMHIKHLLVSFPGTPAGQGLLVGMRAQTQQLHEQTQQLTGTDNETRIRCVAQSVVNLVEGMRSIQAQPLDAVCAKKFHMTDRADGYGLLGNDNNGYVITAAMHASLAATQPDTTSTIKMHAQQVIGATDNLKGWLKTIDQDARSLLVNPDDEEKVKEMIDLSARAFNGVDLDHDGHVDFTPGEAGALHAYQAGQAMADLTLLPTRS